LKMKKSIIITSIFKPTKAVLAFSRLIDHELIVVGDMKTPENWKCKNVQYLSIESQKRTSYKIKKHIPLNHYCRKMFGYLLALSNGAEVIIDTDDDNIPKTNWKFPEFEGKYPMISTDMGFVNIYDFYTKQKIWPRGYPLELVNSGQKLTKKNIVNKEVKVGVWQGLADEDPDVDAVYRLVSNEPCLFSDYGPSVLGKRTITPFNSQNTAFRKELFPLLYLPSFVTFRFTDILRGLVAQPIMWLYGYHLGFINATVTQKRNPHDYMKDFKSEIPMYLHGRDIVDLVSTSISAKKGIEDNLFTAYEQLRKNDIICDKELATLEAWLIDLKK
jgi:hypothetical protein